MLAPICLFTYNRLIETRQTLISLQQNNLALESELFIFSDGAKNELDQHKVDAVRQYIHSITGFKTIKIFESTENLGLASSIINGVTAILAKFENIIVMEDDLIAYTNFLNFMNQSLDYYKNDQRVKSINGYSLKLKSIKNGIYFQTRPFPWGWATWRDRWNKDIFNKQELKNIISNDKTILKKFEKICGQDIAKMLLKSINNKNDSWYVRWAFDHFRENKYSAFPKYSYIQNIGNNCIGTNSNGISCYKSDFFDAENTTIELTGFKAPTKELMNDFLSYFTFRNKLWVRIKLLPTKSGRSLLFADIKQKMSLK